jgi:hypothetical protein
MSLPRSFLLTAMVYALAGMGLGIHMGIGQDFAAAPVHAHINLVGWVTMALFGLIHRAYPALGASKLAWPQFWITQVGAILLVVGIARSIFADEHVIVGIGSILTILAMVLFLAMALIGLRDD